MMSVVSELGNCLSPCGNCGSDRVRCRVRGGAGPRQSAQVVCTDCGARGPLYFGGDAKSQATYDWARSPCPVPLATFERTSRGRQSDRVTPLKRDPLELIARMVVGGSFRESSDGRSTLQFLTSADVAGAVGLMRDPVAKQVVAAVALRGLGVSIASLGRLLAKRVMRQMQWEHKNGHGSTLRMDEPADRWRVRLVLEDAFNDLVWPGKKVPATKAAKAVKMRKGAYLSVYAIAADTLSKAVEEGRRDFRKRLFSVYEGRARVSVRSHAGPR